MEEFGGLTPGRTQTELSMVDAGPQNTTADNATAANVTFPSTQTVYGNVTFNATNPGTPPAPPSRVTDLQRNEGAAQLPLFPMVNGVYGLVRPIRNICTFLCQSRLLSI